ncbi:MAG TPA: AAA family ATPase [Myxococcota bacterium]|nr:AAA family ATPase [Myxococcota bacterium]
MSSTGDELRAMVRAGWRILALETFEEDRAVGLLERVAAALERRCITWSCAAGLGGDEKSAGSLEAGLRAVERVAEPAVFVMLDAHRGLHDAVAVRRLRDMLPGLGSRKQCVVLLGPAFDVPQELVRETGQVELPLPGPAELRGVLKKVLESAQVSGDEEHFESCVRAALGLTGGEATRAFRKALRAAGALDDAAVGEVVRDKRRALRRTQALSFHDDPAGLAEVGGLGELKHWLSERRRAFADEARQFGLPLPRGLLMLGVQGCGKSLAAKAVAREWRFPLLRLDLAAAFGGADRPEAVLREAMQVSESLAPAVLWIDEIEKGFAATDEDPTATRILGTFLTWLSEKRQPVFVVATANDVKGLPPELLRRGRFDELFFVDLPSANERREILAIHLARHGRDPAHYDLEPLAQESERLTGAELEQAVGSALYAAFAEGRELDDTDLMRAVEETVPIYDTYEERIKELRDWARGRARAASLDGRIAELFQTHGTR